MSRNRLRARLERLENQNPAARGVDWSNLHRRPDEIRPDSSGIDWPALFLDARDDPDPGADRIVRVRLA